MRTAYRIALAAPLAVVLLAVAVGHLALYREHNRESPVQWNWDGKVFFGDAKSYATPRTTAEVVAVVKKAYDTNGRVHAVGFGHSWNDIARAEHLVSLELMTRILAVDTVKRQITVQAGAQLRDVQAELVRHGLSFENLPSVDEQTMAGVVSTATHGTGLAFDNLSNRVLSLELVNGKGELMRFDATGNNSDAFDGVRVGLGALGIITELTLQAVPLRLLHERQAPITKADWTNVTGADGTPGLLQFAHDNEHVKMWMEPHRGTAQLFRANRAPEGAVVRGSIARAVDDPQKALMEMIQWVLSFGPLNSLFQWFLPTIIAIGMPVVDRVDVPSQVWVIPHYLSPHQETEWNVPVAQCVPVLDDVQRWVRDNAFPSNHLIEVRFVKADKLWLSPNYDMESCHITLLHCNGDERVRQYFGAFEQLLERYGARPHWAKTFYAGAKRLASVYPKWNDFVRLRKRLDPKGVFRNPWLERLFDYDS